MSAEVDLEALNSAPSFNAWGVGSTRSLQIPAGSAAIDLVTSSSSGLGMSHLSRFSCVFVCMSDLCLFVGLLVQIRSPFCQIPGWIFDL